MITYYRIALFAITLSDPGGYFSYTDTSAGSTTIQHTTT